MIRNYLLVTARNLLKNKSYVIINVLGLGVSLACCIAAYLLLAFNIEFDNFHSDEKVAKIFTVHSTLRDKDNKVLLQNNAPMPFGPRVAEEVGGVERFTRYMDWNGFVRYGENGFSERIAFADSTFFDMFDYPLLKGSHRSFKNKHSVFLSEEIAVKYFGEEDAIGKILVLNFPGNVEIEVSVAGVMKKVPINNSFYFGMMMRFENFLDIYKLEVDNWGDWHDPSTFVELSSPADYGDFEKQFVPYTKLRNEAKKDVTAESYALEPFKSNFTQGEIYWSQANLRIHPAPLVIFTSMAGLILLIACFNLTNTSIAMTSRRLKEVGIRKAIGAARKQIMLQFLFETVIMIVLSMVTALLIAQWMVPVYMGMWRIPYGMSDLSGLNLFISLTFLVFVVAMVAGLYPALFNSKFNPVALLKGRVKVGGTNALTRALVTGQFSLSVVVLIAGVMSMLNSKYQEEIDFGYDQEMVLAIPISSEKEFELLRNAAASNPDILATSVSDHHVAQNTYSFPVKVDTGEYSAQLIGVGKDYMQTMGFTFISGRPFDMDNATDKVEAVIVNRAFVEKLNLTNPMDQLIEVHEVKRRVIGVIETHVDNLFVSSEPQPFVFYPAGSADFKTMCVRTEEADRAEVNTFMEAQWKKLFPEKPYQGRYQSDILLGDMRQINGNLRTVFLFLTVLGALLSASGIYSLSSLNIAKRTKEIGVRKALGASVSSVMTLLNREFVVILAIAGVLGSIGGFYVTDALMDQIYAHYVPVGLVPVLLSALFIFVLGIFTTSVTILRAARSNPVETLRSE